MSKPNTREELKSYCLRKLGAPVLEINVADEQVEDGVDDALQYFHDYHFDGVERVFLKQEITQTMIDANSDGSQGGIDIDDSIISVVGIKPVTTSTTGIFDVRYQIMLNEVHSFASASITHYNITKQHLAELEFFLGKQTPIRYNRHMDKLFLDVDWGQYFKDGNYIIIECYRALNPETYSQVYNDLFIKRYLVQLIKRQWGQNLIKYSGMQLPGGVQFDGNKMFDDAQTAIEKLEDEMIDKYSLPIDFQVG